MAKYVCDFDQVKANGENLCQAGTVLSSAINNYSSGINRSLSTWSGDAATAFNESNSKQVETSLANAEYIHSLGEFVKEAAQSIENLENELASLTI